MYKRFRILVVDDDPMNILVLKSLLKEEYDVLTAYNGYDAISLLKEHMVDLVILDVMMPDLSGLDVCRIIKSDDMFAEIPIIFLTALDSDDDEFAGLELGVVDYLAKPVNYELLKLRVRNHIALKERSDLVKEQRDLLAAQKEELETALVRVKQLEGLIPICAYCKKIRDDKDAWNQLEQYISEHSEARFTHSICPECVKVQLAIIGGLDPE